MSCSNPLIDVSEILSMASTRNGGDLTEVTNPSAKFIVFDGMKFQSEYFHDPLTTQDCSNPAPLNPNASQLAFILTIWEAIMLLPTAQGSNVSPAYLPNIAGGVLQTGDSADRVLWKRVSHLNVVGFKAFPLVINSNPDSTLRYQGSGPVVVKTRCRIDDRHCLYYVRNFVHDIFLNGMAPGPCGVLDCDNCNSDNTSPGCGSIPLSNDFYSKIFYHVRG